MTETSSDVWYDPDKLREKLAKLGGGLDRRVMVTHEVMLEEQLDMLLFHLRGEEKLFFINELMKSIDDGDMYDTYLRMLVTDRYPTVVIPERKTDGST